MSKLRGDQRMSNCENHCYSIPLTNRYILPTCNCNNSRDFRVKMENVRVISANPMEIARVTKYVWKMSVQILNVREIDSAKG